MDFTKNHIVVKLRKPYSVCRELRQLIDKYAVETRCLFPKIRQTERAKERARLRGRGQVPNIKREWLIILREDNAKELLPEFQFCPDVIEARLDTIPEPLYAPNDPLWADCWHLKAGAKGTMNAEKAWDDETTKGEGIVVAIIEQTPQGFRYTHEDLGGTGNQANDWAAIQNGTHPCFLVFTDDEGDPIDPWGTEHGTYTAGCVISQIDNNKGVVGMAPGAKVMACLSNSFSWAIQRAADLGADIISVSYGSGGAGWKTAIDYAVSQGAVVVWAHWSNSFTESWLGYSEKAVLVNAHDSGGSHHYSYGNVDVSAPGDNVRTVTPSGDNTYGWGAGESFATPYVASIIALLIKKNPSWGVFDIRQALRQGARKNTDDPEYPMGTEPWSKYYGWGMADADAALGLSQGILSPMPPERFEASEGNFSIGFTWKVLPISSHLRCEIREKKTPIQSVQAMGR